MCAWGGGAWAPLSGCGGAGGHGPLHTFGDRLKRSKPPGSESGGKGQTQLGCLPLPHVEIGSGAGGGGGGWRLGKVVGPIEPI